MVKRKGDPKLAFLAILMAALLGGGIAPFIKIGVREIPPLSFTFLRFVLASLFLAPFFIKENSRVGKDIFKIVLFSLLATVNVTFFAFGVKKTTATVAQMLYAAVPIIASSLSYLILKEKIRPRTIIGAGLGLLGVSLIIILPTIEQSFPFKGNLMGNLLIFVGVFSFSLYSVFSKKFQENYSPAYLTTVFFLTTTFVLFFLSFGEFTSYPYWWSNISLDSLLSLLYVGFIGTALFYLLYQYALKHGTPVIASMTLYLQPAATFIWAAIILGERVTFGFIIGAILALTGAWLVTWSKNVA